MTALPARIAAPRSLVGDRVVPVFVVGASPQSVASIVEVAAMAPGAWATDTGRLNLVESIPEHHPEAYGWKSSRLTAANVLPDTACRLTDRLLTLVRNRDDLLPTDEDLPITVVQDSVLDALRIPFLAEAFPNARFVYVQRSVSEALAEMEAVWRSRRYTTYVPPEWEGPPWSLTLIPGWRELAGRTVKEIVTAQWNALLEYVIDDLKDLGSDRWCSVSYDRLLIDPDAGLRRALGAVGLALDERTCAGVRSKSSGGTAADRAGMTRPVDDRPRRRPATQGLNVRYTPEFPALLHEFGISLLVTKYEANGALLCLSEHDGDLRVLARPYENPAGIALTGSVLSVGSRRRIEVLRDRLPELNTVRTGSEDACFIPSVTYTTGDLGVREMAYAGGRLNVVSAIYSALGVIGADQQIEPCWLPPFITSIAPEDRCHLNGLAVVGDEIGYVSALATTDTERGWRDRKLDGGVVMNVKTGEVAVDGLCVPHSPRWRDGRLWILESGTGSLLCADPVTGEKETVYAAPGFGRGLALIGRLAFVGFSQGRGNVLRGLPIEKETARTAGIRVIDTQTGEVVASLMFDDAGEVFDIQILHGRRLPDVADAGGRLISQCFMSRELKNENSRLGEDRRRM